MSKTINYSPVVKADDYKNIDGRKAYDSNVTSISIGISEEEKNGMILQIENTDRGVHQIPLHQLIDMTIMACKTKEYLLEAYHIKDADKEGTVIARAAAQGDAMTLTVCGDKEGFTKLTDEFVKNDEMLSERLSTLARLLREMRY